MNEYYVQIMTNTYEHPRCVYEFYNYEDAINYIAQNPLSSADEEYRIGIPSYDDEGLSGMEYLYPPEFAEDVEKIRKGENYDKYL